MFSLMQKKENEEDDKCSGSRQDITNKELAGQFPYSNTAKSRMLSEVRDGQVSCTQIPDEGG
jgi:hypothetical protein